MSLEVSIVPDAAAIAMTQRVVDDMARCISRDQDVGWRLAMATHELLDNARKYGREEVASFRFEIVATDAGHVANMHVRSHGTSGHIAALQGTMKGIDQAADAWSFYLDALQRCADSDDDRSGLGLARICAEGEMRLFISVEEGEYVSVGAELRFEAA
jgi:hypothetical protein